MNVVKSLSLVPLVVLALSSPASGQDGPDGPPARYLTGIGGAAFSVEFEEPTAMFAVEYGERVHTDVQAYANLSYVTDLMSERMQQNLVLAGETLTVLDGILWEFEGRDRGMAFTVGGKFLMPITARFRPYVGGGLGILNLKRRISERDLGDVTDGFYGLTGLNDGVMDAGATSATKPLAEILVGFGGAAGRTYVDIAYRYRRAFHSFEPIEFGQLTFGVGVAWR